jgi:hypothetical protein
MGEYLAMQQDLREYKKLQEAVASYLDDFFDADENGDRIPWPGELEELVEWRQRRERDD